MTRELIDSKLKEIREVQGKHAAFVHAMGILQYDQETVAPEESGEGRGRTMGMLGGLDYELMTDKKLAETLNELLENKESLTEEELREVNLLNKHVKETSAIPQEEYVDFIVLVDAAQVAWKKAKNSNDFDLFAPYLEKIVATNIKFAGYYNPQLAPYDALIDQFEEGMDMKTLDEFFAKLRDGLKPLIAKIAKAPQIDDSFFKRNYPKADQREFSHAIMDMMGLDTKRVILGESEHPFTENFSNSDVRITTHYYENAPESSMFSVLHEGGHAMYELNADDKYNWTVFGGGVSMGIHESQSRFYENILGRSFEFTKALFQCGKKFFPEQLKDVTHEMFWKAVNKAEPSLIRVEADELTYSFHIMVRYEIEKRLIDGSLAVKDVPKVWDDMYEEYLGVRPTSFKEGCLQDSHWSGGTLGYFPTYALGSAYGAQMLDVMKKDIPNLWEDVEKGDLSKVTAWLKEHIHRHASFYRPKEVFEKACGKFDAQHFVDYLTEKYTKLYNL